MASLSRAMTRTYHRDGLPGVHQDGIPDARAHQGHADRLLTRFGADHGHLVLEQPQHGHLHRGVRAGDACLADALGQTLAHVTTPGPSTPGCSKNTWTSSHSTW